MSIKYSDQKSVQILISLLKQYGVTQIIADPGTSVTNLIGSIKNDPDFTIYSCVDERSAAYMACGIAAESGKPVALTCTGATASRNYLSGFTEAYYRKLPIVAITNTLFTGNIGHNIPQVIDRSNVLNDVVNTSVNIRDINTVNDEWYAIIELNKALTALTKNGGGPVHINLEIAGAPHFSVATLPKAKKINFFAQDSILPEIAANKNIGIFVGNHSSWSQDLTEAVDSFVEKYNAVVLCDSTSNYPGKYGIMANIILDQENYSFDQNDFDILIHIGNVSGSYLKINAKSVWRVNPDGKIVDTFKKLSNVFEMEEETFFSAYNKKVSKPSNLKNYNTWKQEYEKIHKKLTECELPLSNIWVNRELSGKIDENSAVHLGILSSLRSFNSTNTRTAGNYGNTGGFGIDGGLSSFVGASFVHPEKNYYAIIGDLAFFYDMNVLGNRDIKNNLRIILINNGGGAEFHTHINPAYQTLGHEGASKYIAADGHFGNKSKTLVKNYVESLGFEYKPVYTKEDFIGIEKYFTDKKMHDKSLIVEVFTTMEDENLALRQIRALESSLTGKIKHSIKRTATRALSSSAKKVIKKILK